MASHWIIQQCLCSTVWTLTKMSSDSTVVLRFSTSANGAMEFASEAKATEFAEWLDLGSYQVVEVKP